MDPGQYFENLHLKQNSSVGPGKLPSACLPGVHFSRCSSQSSGRLPAGPGAGRLGPRRLPALLWWFQAGFHGDLFGEAEAAGKVWSKTSFYILLSLLTICPTSNVISVGHESEFLRRLNLKVAYIHSFRASGIMQGGLSFVCVLVPFPLILAVLEIRT